MIRLQAMAHLIHLFFVLATMQIQPVVTEVQGGINVTLDKCPQKWTVREQHSNIKVVKIWCWKANSTIKLKVRALPWKCSLQHACRYTCLNIKINSFGLSLEIKNVSKNENQTKEIIMCKKYCKNECPKCNKTECKERLLLKVRKTDILTNSMINVQFKGTRELNVTDDDDIKTESLQIYYEAKSWIKALQHCHNLNSTLVQIIDVAVEEELMSLLDEKKELQNGIWIGMERSILGTNMEWKWTSGIRAEWDSRFSKDPLNNHCGKIVWVEESQDVQLLDDNCHEKLPFICQNSLETV